LSIHPEQSDVRFFQDACPDYEDAANRAFPRIYEMWLRAGFAVRYVGRADVGLAREELERVRDDIRVELKRLNRRKDISHGSH
jgi:hypothetical protein